MAFYAQVGSKSKNVLDEQLTSTIQYGVYLIIDYCSGMFCVVGHGIIVVYMQSLIVLFVGRPEAVEVGRELVKRKFCYSVPLIGDFQDGKVLYKFISGKRQI